MYTCCFRKKIITKNVDLILYLVMIQVKCSPYKTCTSHTKIYPSFKMFLIKGKSFINILQLIILYMKQKQDERINFRNIGS